MQAVNGYLEDGRFTPLEAVTLPRRVPAVLVFNAGEAEDSPAKKQRKAIDKFLEAMRTSDEALPPEFDEIISQRVNVTRELDL